MNDVQRILSADSAAFLKVRKRDAVYHAVKRSILLRQLQPGENLLEQHIAGALSCSQGTVREALMRLEQDGLVARRGYQGTVVSDTSPAEAAQMVKIRIDVETAAIRRAAQTLSNDDLQALDAIADDMHEAEIETDAYARSELDRLFHRTLFQASDLPALEPILMRCALHMHRYTFGYDGAEKKRYRSGDHPSVSEQHRALLIPLRARDPDAAADAIKRHILDVLELWSSVLRRAVTDHDKTDE